MLNIKEYSSQDISILCDGLSDERRSQAVAFLQYLVQQENAAKFVQTKNAFSQIDELIGTQNIWQNEQEMLNELAEFRRHRG